LTSATPSTAIRWGRNTVSASVRTSVSERPFAVRPTTITVLAEDVSGVIAGAATPTGMRLASEVMRSATTCRFR
jgi:hypothetical protein